ncbi:MAG: CTP-dependent riboflavin kinase [Methanobacterium sp.]|nr:CTP-dependent riboflavin kinase [Methanobacterium sp.]
MEIKGIISSGMGKGTYFMSQKFYINQFIEKLGFKPFIGTLNIKIEPKEIARIIEIPNNKFGIIHGEGKFGDVKFVKAILNNIVEGAIVFPAKTKHTEDVIEFISHKNLRKYLNLKDGKQVSVKI